MLLGTITHGTLRPQDLIPAFLDALEDVAPDRYAQLLAMPVAPVPAHAMEDEDAEWWDSEDATYLLDDLTDTLSEHAPEYCYFGTHEGDGSAFGFWIDWDAIAEAARDEDVLIVDDLGARGGHRGCTLVVNDHGNATLYDSNDSVLWEVV